MSLEKQLIPYFKKAIENYMTTNNCSKNRANEFIQNHTEKIKTIIAEMCEMGFDTSGINFISNLSEHREQLIYTHIINEFEFIEEIDTFIENNNAS